jgi:hypothetical protein
MMKIVYRGLDYYFIIIILNNSNVVMDFFLSIEKISSYIILKIKKQK